MMNERHINCGSMSKTVAVKVKSIKKEVGPMSTTAFVKGKKNTSTLYRSKGACCSTIGQSFQSELHPCMVYVSLEPTTPH